MDQFLNPFDHFNVPFGVWAERALEWIVGHSRSTLLAAKVPVQSFLEFVQGSLEAIPPLVASKRSRRSSGSSPWRLSAIFWKGGDWR